MRDLNGLKAALDRRDHHAADHLTKDAGIAYSAPSDDLPVARINGKDDADHLAIVCTDLELIRTPADNWSA